MCGHIIRQEGKQRKILEGKVEGKRGRGIPRATWTDNTKVQIEEFKYEDLIGTAHCSHQRRSLTTDLRGGGGGWHHVVMLLMLLLLLLFSAAATLCFCHHDDDDIKRYIDHIKHIESAMIDKAYPKVTGFSHSCCR